MDEHKQVPFKYILKVQPVIDGDLKKGGTGFFINERCLLTNRHLVWNRRSSKLYDEIKITAGFIGYNKEPLFGSQTVIIQQNVNLFLPENFLSGRNDFAMIVLADNTLFNQIYKKPNEKFTLALVPFSKSKLLDKTLMLTGYTGWKRNTNRKRRGRLYNIKVTFKKTVNGEIRYYANNVRGGNSGSPLWNKINDIYETVGIHRRGATRHEIFGRRHGVQFTEDNIALINDWVALATK